MLYQFFISDYGKSIQIAKYIILLSYSKQRKLDILAQISIIQSI